jgi:hypothetical protein
MADAVTNAMRIGAVAGGAAGYFGSSELHRRIGDSGSAKVQLGLALTGGAGAAVEFAHHGMSGFARQAWHVDAQEAIRPGWHRLGISWGARNVGLVVASAAMLGAVGIGFAPRKWAD